MTTKGRGQTPRLWFHLGPQEVPPLGHLRRGIGGPREGEKGSAKYLGLDLLNPNKKNLGIRWGAVAMI